MHHHKLLRPEALWCAHRHEISAVWQLAHVEVEAAFLHIVQGAAANEAACEIKDTSLNFHSGIVQCKAQVDLGGVEFCKLDNSLLSLSRKG